MYYEAVKSYTKALVSNHFIKSYYSFYFTNIQDLNPNNHIVFCNRAQAYKKLKNFQMMYDDSV